MTMNKQEVMKILTDTKHDYEFCWSDDFRTGFIEGINCSLKAINQLNEPEKPVVPQFVADWYEDNKDEFEYNVYDLCVKFHEYELNGEIKNWFDGMNNKPLETLVNMHQFGYEVEKEKRYTARLKFVTRENSGFINRNTESGWISISDLSTFAGKYQVRFTQAELEEMDVWHNTAFEIEEVEE